MYYLKRKTKKNKVTEINEIKGFVVKPKKKNGDIIVNKITIVDSEISNNYIKKQLDKKFKRMYKKINEYLNEDESTEDGIKACLGEIEKLKSFIFFKYQEFLKKKLYQEYLAKIVLTEQELKKKDLEREFFNRIIKNYSPVQMNNYEEERGRSR